MFDLTDILPALPEMILAGLALLLVLVAAFGGDGSKMLVVTMISLAGIVLVSVLIWSGDSIATTAFGGLFRADGFADYMKFLVLIGTLPRFICDHSACQKTMSTSRNLHCLLCWRLLA